MKISAVFSRNRNKNYFDTEFKNLIIIIVTFIIAVISGTIIVFTNYSFFEKTLGSLFLSFFTGYSSKSLYMIILSEICNEALFLLLCIVFGSSAYGKAPIIATVFLKIEGLATIASYILSAYQLKGLEYYLLIYLPGNILIIFTVLFVAVKCLNRSEIIKKIIIKNNSAEYEKLTYVKQFIFASVVIIISALTDSILIRVFSPLFSFS